MQDGILGERTHTAESMEHSGIVSFCAHACDQQACANVECGSSRAS